MVNTTSAAYVLHYPNQASSFHVFKQSLCRSKHGSNVRKECTSITLLPSRKRFALLLTCVDENCQVSSFYPLTITVSFITAAVSSVSKESPVRRHLPCHLYTRAESTRLPQVCLSAEKCSVNCCVRKAVMRRQGGEGGESLHQARWIYLHRLDTCAWDCESISPLFYSSTSRI